MQENQTPSSPAATSVRPLWLTIGALAVVVAALGGTLLGTQLSAGPSPGLASGLVPFEEVQSAPTAQRSSQGLPPGAAVAREDAAQTARSAPAVVRAPAPAVQPAPVTRCDVCGTVVSVTAVQRAAPASGIGAVAGGVVGGVLGNQIGGGSGRAVATVLGAVGGGFAGNAAEKHVRQTTRYAVRVRMDDGSMRTVEQSAAVTVGSPVLVQGGSVRLRDPAAARSG